MNRKQALSVLKNKRQYIFFCEQWTFFTVKIKTGAIKNTSPGYQFFSLNKQGKINVLNSTTVITGQQTHSLQN